MSDRHPYVVAAVAVLAMLTLAFWPMVFGCKGCS